MTKRQLFLAGCAVLASACASHSRPAPIGDPSQPRLGWVIMHGSADNPDEEFACQSNPRGACVLPVSSAQRKVVSEVHLYFHPIGAEARYEGSVQIEFFGDGRPSPLSLTVDPKSVGNDSIVGIVTDRPGEYALNVSATTTTPGGRRQLTERVPVTVK